MVEACRTLEEIGNIYTISVGNLMGRSLLRDIGVDGRIR
jgi:hypothetical protein